MAEIIIKNVKENKEISKEIAKQIISLSQQSLSTQAEAAKEFIKNNIVLVKAIEEMGEEIADMDEEIEEAQCKIKHLVSKIGMTDKEFINEWKNIKFKLQDTDRNERVLKRMKRRLESQKTLK